MNRRQFLRAGLMTIPSFSVGAEVLAQIVQEPQWRTYEIVTSVQVLQPSGTTRVWLPQPLADRTAFQRSVARGVHCEGGKIRTYDNSHGGMKILAAEFPAGVPPLLTMTEQVATRNWSVDLVGSPSQPGSALPPQVAAFLEPTRYIPTGGLVKTRAEQITRGASTDLEKAQAIYQWIVENTYRDPKVRGCGFGDIVPMLQTGNLGGKCADLNALFVGLAKASGIPARDVYGIRLGPSALECKSLGTDPSGVITKAQHCRAEVYLHHFGWVPMDPADVRKVVLEESPGHLPLSDSKVQSARRRLFGSWEMNWMAYNYAQDVTLPGSSGPPLHFFMYPQAETSEGRVDSLDPAAFHYEISAHELRS
ncbi:MAG TPA: transglutaminase domain-containing protein [Acidobacteriaceae bacterium]|nr:transglutaminase domain-containing protein [Acidobacteriaceae bacterium]